jgi:CRP-like cAMP-binding protein
MDLLRDVPAEEAARVLAECRRRRYGRGDHLFTEGEQPDGVHLIAEGRVAIRVSSTSGDEATVDVVGPGDAVGELALLPPAGPRSATAVALETVETIVLSATSFTDLRTRFPSITDVLLSMLARRNRTMVAILAEALYAPAEIRVGSRLLDVSARWSDGSSGGVIPLTQADLAGLAGTTRETVNRVLHALAAEGMIEIGRGRVLVIDPDGLSRRFGQKV